MRRTLAKKEHPISQLGVLKILCFQHFQSFFYNFYAQIAHIGIEHCHHTVAGLGVDKDRRIVRIVIAGMTIEVTVLIGADKDAVAVVNHGVFGFHGVLCNHIPEGFLLQQALAGIGYTATEKESCEFTHIGHIGIHTGAGVVPGEVRS